jgi:predicted membrane metal-binding protein
MLLSTIGVHVNSFGDNGAQSQMSGGSNRSFGLLFAAVCVVAAFWPAVHGKPLRLWTLPFGAAFLIVALVKPAWLAPLNRLWTALGALLNRVVSPIVTAIVYLLVVTPMAIVMRSRGTDLLRLKTDPEASTYWIYRDPPGPPAESMVNQY